LPLILDSSEPVLRFGNRLLRTAQTVGTVKAEGDARFALLEKHLKEWQPDAIVIGVPYHPDGAPHENTARAKKFGRQLHGRFSAAGV
jgi:putative Holliday junction resolvase